MSQTAQTQFIPQWLRKSTHNTPTTESISAPSPLSSTTPHLDVPTYSSIANPAQPTTPAGVVAVADNPFRYSREQILGMWDPKRVVQMPLEMEKHNIMVTETPVVPVGCRELTDAEKKIFAGPIHSEVKRRPHHHSHASDLGFERNPEGGNSGHTPRPDRFRREQSGTLGSGKDSPNRERFSGIQGGVLGGLGGGTPSRRREGSDYARRTPLASPTTANSDRWGSARSPGSFDGVLGRSGGSTDWGRKEGEESGWASRFKKVPLANSGSTVASEDDELLKVNENGEKIKYASSVLRRNRPSLQNYAAAAANTGRRTNGEPRTPFTEDPPCTILEDEPSSATGQVTSVLGSLALDADDDPIPPRVRSAVASAAPSRTGSEVGGPTSGPPPGWESKPAAPSPATEWVYKDPTGTVQGPFAADMMQDWFRQNYFPNDLNVRRIDEPHFQPLQALISKVVDKTRPFHSAFIPVVPVPTPAPPQQSHQPPALNLSSLSRFNAASGSAHSSPVVAHATPSIHLLQQQQFSQQQMSIQSPFDAFPPAPRTSGWDSPSIGSPAISRAGWGGLGLGAQQSPVPSSAVATPFRPGFDAFGTGSPGPSREELLLALRQREILEQQQAQLAAATQQQPGDSFLSALAGHQHVPSPPPFGAAPMQDPFGHVARMPTYDPFGRATPNGWPPQGDNVLGDPQQQQYAMQFQQSQPQMQPQQQQHWTPSPVPEHRQELAVPVGQPVAPPTSQQQPSEPSPAPVAGKQEVPQVFAPSPSPVAQTPSPAPAPAIAPSPTATSAPPPRTPPPAPSITSAPTPAIAPATPAPQSCPASVLPIPSPRPPPTQPKAAAAAGLTSPTGPKKQTLVGIPTGPSAPTQPRARQQQHAQAQAPASAVSPPPAPSGKLSVVSKADFEAQQQRAATAAEGTINVSLGDLISTPASAATTTTPVAPNKLAPWAQDKGNDGASTSVTLGPSLREIQEAEAKQAEARKAAERQARAALAPAASSTSDEPLVPGTTSWGLASVGQGLASLATSNAPAIPAWHTGNTGTKKTLKQIQEEEERRKALAVQQQQAQAQALNTAAKRDYAQSAANIAARQLTPITTAPVTGGAWNVVGPKGTTTPVGGARPTAPAALRANGAPIPAKPSTPVSVAPSSAPKAPRAQGPSDDFIRWLHATLSGALNGVNVDDFRSMLLSLDAERPDVDLISDMVNASSSTLDGRRFALEFAKRIKADRSGEFVASGGNLLANVVKAPPPKQQESFKVVTKKKRSGAR